MGFELAIAQYNVIVLEYWTDYTGPGGRQCVFLVPCHLEICINENITHDLQ